jgi:hypothetical protein
VDTYNLAVLKNLRGDQQVRAFFRKVHLERLQSEHGVSAEDLRHWMKKTPMRDWRTFFNQNVQRIADNQGKVHLLLTAAPLPGLQDVYERVFEKILNERISSKPVIVTGG